MSPEQQKIFEVVKAHTLKVLIDLDPAQVTIEKSLSDLGANSVDRLEVVMNAIDALNLQVPLTALQGVRDLRGLVDLLGRYAERS